MVVAGTLAVAIALVVITVPVGVAEPECRALGEFQIQPIVFQCGGSAWSSSGARGSEFIELLPPRTAKNIVDVPAGTKDFFITMQPKTSHQGVAGQIHVQNIETGDFIVKKMLKPESLKAGNQDKLFVYNWTFAGGQVDVEYWEHNTVSPRSQQVKFHGALPVKIRIQATNALAVDTLFRFKRYQYGAFDSSKPSGHMCHPNAMSLNCKPYYQYFAREIAIGWCAKVKSKWPDAEKGWQEMWDRDLCPADILPSYMWERTWAKVEVLTWNSRRAWQSYKFLSNGGFETNSPGVTRVQWTFCYNLDKINTFAEKCCGVLKTKYPGGMNDTAFQVTAKDFGTTVWDACMNLPEALGVTQHDYERYLDVDGYQGVLRKDLEYCWNPPTTPHPPSTTTIRPLPTATPRATTQQTTMKPNRAGCARLIVRASPGDVKLEVNDAGGTGWQANHGGGPGRAPAKAGTMVQISDREFVTIRGLGATSVTLTSPIKGRYSVGTEVCEAKKTTTPHPGTSTVSGATSTVSLPTPHPGSTTSAAPTNVTIGPTNGTGVNCKFTAAPRCLGQFAYKGHTITGCTTLDHKGGGWCSEDQTFNLGGRWHRCTWDCTSPHTCSWKQQQGCVQSFSFDGHQFGIGTNGCTKYRYNTAWCSGVDKFIEGVNNWRHCIWDCKCYWKPSWECAPAFTYKGQPYKGCTSEDHWGKAWCSQDAVFNGKWSPCTRFCPRDPGDRTEIPKPSTISATKCHWKAPAKCPQYWTYPLYGTQIQGCTGQDHVGQWCSNDPVFKGSWSHCEWTCDAPVRCHYAMAPGCKMNFVHKGITYSGCTKEDSVHNKPWCSLDRNPQGSTGNWAYCNWECPCFWQRHPECVDSFYPFAGAQDAVQGCAVSGGSGWCSTTEQFSGHYRWCSWACVKDTGKGKKFPYAWLGVGVGAGTAAVGGAIWGTVAATTRRRGTNYPDASMSTQQAQQQAIDQQDMYGGLQTGPAKKYSEHDISVAVAVKVVPTTTNPLLAMAVIAGICSFCILVVVGVRISAKQRTTYRRLDEDAEDADLTE